MPFYVFVVDNFRKRNYLNMNRKFADKIFITFKTGGVDVRGRRGRIFFPRVPFERRGARVIACITIIREVHVQRN